MTIKKWTLHWDVGQKEDGSWVFFRVDPSTSAELQDVALAYVAIAKDTIRVDMEILVLPPIPPPFTRPDGARVTLKPFDLESVEVLVWDLLLYDVLNPDIKGKSFGTLTFYDKKTGAVVKEATNRTF